MPCKLSYPRAVFIAWDQLVNAHLRGWPDETLSSRFWRWHVSGRRSWPKNLVDALFFWDKDKKSGKRHCQLSFESECEMRQMPPECRMADLRAREALVTKPNGR